MNNPEPKPLTREELLESCTRVEDYIAGAYSAFNHANNPVLCLKRFQLAQAFLRALINRLEEIPAFQDKETTK
jgi:hypothetical protein